MKLLTKIILLATLCATSAYQLHAAAALSTSLGKAGISSSLTALVPKTIASLAHTLEAQESTLAAALKTYNTSYHTSPEYCLYLAHYLKTPQLLMQHYVGFNVMTKKCMIAALETACTYGHSAIVEALLNLGIDINCIFNDKQARPLIVAVYHQHIDIAALLLQRGANPNDTLIDGSTPCLYATAANNTEMTQLLLSFSANPLTTNDLGFSAFHHVLYHENSALLKLIASLEIDMVLKPDGTTALMFASEFGCKEAVEILLANKACITLRNTHGSSALDIAAEHDHLKIALTLTERHIQEASYSFIERALHVAHHHGRIEIAHAPQNILIKLNDASAAAA